MLGMGAGLALVAALALPAGADRDDNMVVGRANGAKGYNTSLYSTNPTATLSLVNNRTAGAPALDLMVKGGPALAVNTKGWVENLNADFVDGRGVNRLQVLKGWCFEDNAPDGADWSCDAGGFTAPAAGELFASASIDLDYNGSSSNIIECSILVKAGTSAGTYVPSIRKTTLSTGNRWDSCDTDTLLRDIDPGEQVTVRFDVTDVGPTTELKNAVVYWFFVPD
jgi:hypothetical protein